VAMTASTVRMTRFSLKAITIQRAAESDVANYKLVNCGCSSN
jgi:hypothetical protein